MPLLTVKVDSTLARQLLGDQQRQMPFALKNAINTVGLQGQAAERTHMGAVFTLRKPDFLNKQGVKVLDGFATKSRLSITLGPSESANFLAKFEDGDTKVARGLSLAVPIDVKRNKKDLVTKGNKPKAFGFQRMKTNTGTGIQVFAGEKRTFMVRYPDGRGWIFKRTGKGKWGELFTGTSVLYALKHTAKVDNRLHLVTTVSKAVEAGWEAAVTDAVGKALASTR